MNNLVSPSISVELKEHLDKIDERVKKDVKNGFKDSRKRIEIGMWEKGEAIAAEFTPLKTAPSWRQLSRETGRDDKALKRWFELYMRYPSLEKYLPIAEAKAEEWTKNWLMSMQALSGNGHEALDEPQDERIAFLRDWQGCLLRHYSPKEEFERTTEECKSCLKILHCRKLASLYDDVLARRQIIVKS